jgi:hypothetical protein
MVRCDPFMATLAHRAAGSLRQSIYASAAAVQSESQEELPFSFAEKPIERRFRTACCPHRIRHLRSSNARKRL